MLPSFLPLSLLSSPPLSSLLSPPSSHLPPLTSLLPPPSSRLLQVLRSAREHLAKIDLMKLEVTAEHCASLTLGAPHCSEVVAFARQAGFDHVTAPHLGSGFTLEAGDNCSAIPWHTAGGSQCQLDLAFTRA